MLKNSLHIYTIDAQGDKVAFPSTQSPAILSEWNYNAERMASAPTIKGTLMCKLCLDDLWTDKEFVEFNGERFYVDQTPTSSKDTEDVRYKHDITFVSERIKLENIYFLDVVTSETELQYKDRFRSNGAKFRFFGTLHELVSRLNDSLIYSKLYNPETKEGYHIVIDEDISVSEEKEISLENVYFATALQEIYNQFKIPYYWVGKTCHVGYNENAIATPFEYGQDNGLLSVTKTNANFRIINRITGTGSSDNIQHYYPNDDPYGIAVFETENISETRVASVLLAKIISYNSRYLGSVYTLYKNITPSGANILNGSTVLCHNAEDELSASGSIVLDPFMGQDVVMPGVALDTKTFSINMGYGRTSGARYNKKRGRVKLSIKIKGTKNSKIDVNSFLFQANLTPILGVTYPADIKLSVSKKFYIGLWDETSLDTRYDFLSGEYVFNANKDYRLTMFLDVTVDNMDKLEKDFPLTVICAIGGDIQYKYIPESEYSFVYSDGKDISYENSGITLLNVTNLPCGEITYNYNNGTWDKIYSTNGSKPPAIIKITGRKWITPSDKLMPSIYRETWGAERFYNALNDTYDHPDGGKYSFNNLFADVNPQEGITTFDNIKPSIKGIKNANGQLLGEITDIAFDADDSDELDKDNYYIHPYFYVKLHIFNGAYGFNLFKQGLENGAMKFTMTSGNCARCEFQVGVSEPKQVEDRYEFNNPVQVDENGNIVAGNYEDKVKLGNIIPRQQDTSKYEVWVALKKENSTFGVVMPNAANNYKPNVGDSFVITNILMPNVYVTHAEKELEDALIKYMSENNDEKFTFSITFSRIYLQRNPDIATMLNENARIIVRYNNHDYSLYVSSYSCKITSDILAEITVELTDEFSTGQSALREKISEIANGLIGEKSLDVLAQGQKYFLSKTQQDRARGKITFEKGIAFGKNGDTLIDGNGNAELLTLIVRQLLRSPKFRNGLTGEGWKIWLEDGLAKMELDELTVRRVMHVFELIIDKIRSVGGQIVVSAANGKIKTIEDAGDAYRIYFEGDNYFMPHDLMRCATYKNGKEQHGYWVEISEAYPDYIVVSKWEFIDGEAPRTGDEVVLMGNTEDDKRQNLILISATEDGQPRIDVLNGVKNKNFTGCLRARFGNLDGIEDDYFPADSQPHGDGLYADNAYLRGTFILRNGKDVITQFNVLEGLINSSVEAIRKDFTEEDGYLNNPNFYSGFLHWYAPSDTKLYLLGDKWIWANDSALSNKGNGSQIKFDDGRTVVDIKNSYITQHNAEMRSKPDIHTNADGDKEPAVVYLSFFYKVIKSGTLRVNFEKGNSDGFIAYETLSARMDVGVTDGYKQFTTSGYWNGTGDFKLSFTGEIYISTIIFSTDKADAMAYRYRTLFEQTDRLVKITAAVFDKDGEALKETGLVIKPEGAGLYAQDSNGKVALIGVSIEEDDGNGGTKSVIKLTADNIQLEGLITANENFKVLADGSIEAKNGKFIGTIDATSGTIGGFKINRWGIGKETQQGGTGNGLSINQRYISIGTAETYSYLGEEGRGILIDNESWGETWAGRFVNTKAREKQYNYGIYIDVENGTKNYGLFSNAPLQAPAYISLTKKDITIDGTGTATFDFENHNLFMVNNTASDGTLVTLPDENTVKNMFEYSKTRPLPPDFATVFTIVMQKGSKSIMLANITNNDGNVNNERLAACDTMQLLCYVGTSGMIYQIINRKN